VQGFVLRAANTKTWQNGEHRQPENGGGGFGGGTGRTGQGSLKTKAAQVGFSNPTAGRRGAASGSEKNVGYKYPTYGGMPHRLANI